MRKRAVRCEGPHTALSDPFHVLMNSLQPLKLPGGFEAVPLQHFEELLVVSPVDGPEGGTLREHCGIKGKPSYKKNGKKALLNRTLNLKSI